MHVLMPLCTKSCLCAWLQGVPNCRQAKALVSPSVHVTSVTQGMGAPQRDETLRWVTPKAVAKMLQSLAEDSPARAVMLAALPSDLAAAALLQVHPHPHSHSHSHFQVRIVRAIYDILPLRYVARLGARHRTHVMYACKYSRFAANASRQRFPPTLPANVAQLVHKEVHAVWHVQLVILPHEVTARTSTLLMHKHSADSQALC
jgi:hypothetical protein